MNEPDDYDPDATIWGAVSELEQKGYTKLEISMALDTVAESLDSETTWVSPDDDGGLPYDVKDD